MRLQNSLLETKLSLLASTNLRSKITNVRSLVYSLRNKCYLDILTNSISLGCFFFIDEDGSYKRIRKDFFMSDENVTQGKSIEKTNSLIDNLGVIDYDGKHNPHNEGLILFVLSNWRKNSMEEPA